MTITIRPTRIVKHIETSDGKVHDVPHGVGADGEPFVVTDVNAMSVARSFLDLPDFVADYAGPPEDSTLIVESLRYDADDDRPLRFIIADAEQRLQARIIAKRETK